MAFNFFNFMLMMGVIGLVYIVYVYLFAQKKGEKIIVDYAENIGDKLIEHTKLYDGFIDESKDILTIPKLNIKRPVPASDNFAPTKSGTKKLYLVKFDIDRYGYRIPNVHNKVYIKEKNKQGNEVLNKYKWKICDDIVEQDAKHWEEQTQEQIKITHRKRDEAWTKWVGPIAMAMIVLLAVIMNTQTVKIAQESVDKIVLERAEIVAEAERTSNNLNNILEKITGQNILKQDEAEKRVEESKNS